MRQLSSAPAVGWRAFGGGDFNGDGKADVAFQSDATGKLAVWLMNGTNSAGGGLLANGKTPALSWHAVSTADFNDDGKPDILFQNDNRSSAVWLMNGINFAGSILLRGGVVPPVGWRIVGTGDFNGDGQTDIVLQCSDGRMAAWYFIGTTFTGSAMLRSNGPAESSGWKIRGVADFNLNGKIDLLWQNVNGRTVIWFFDNATYTGTVPLRKVASGWQIVGPK